MDGITYEVIGKFPEATQQAFLENFNRMFEEGSYQETWRDTLVRFLPKGGGGFRHISLTSCLAKLFERIVQDFQFGLRRGRLTTDAVAVLVSDVNRAFG